MPSRKKIPAEIEADVIFRSNRECVVCDHNKQGDHIHHIDGDKNNNKFENLVFLCFDCHNDASIKGSLKKKLSAKTIIKYRDHKYQVIANQREKALKVFNSSIKGLTTEDLLETTKNALIIIEIEKIKESYFAAEVKDRGDIIMQLHKYYSHTNFRLAVDIYNFLLTVADQTRGGMTRGNATSIFSLVIDFFPHSDQEKNNKKTIQLANQCGNIAFSLVYDSIIHLKDYSIAMYGLTILKYIYKKGKQQKLKPIIDNVNAIYNRIEETLKRPERDDLDDAIELVKVFRSSIEDGSLSFPVLSNKLMKKVSSN